MASDFNWYETDNKSDVVFSTVQGVAVYSNGDGDVVIRQQSTMGEDDSVVVIPLVYVNSVIAAINAAAKVE